MKKTSQGNHSSRPGVRSAYSSSGSSRSYSSSRTPARVSNNRKPSKKKSSGGKVALIATLCVAVLGGGVAALYNTDFGKDLYRKIFNIEQTYQLTNADGTVVEMTETQLREYLSALTYPQGIVVDGTDIGGKTKDEAASILKTAAPEHPIETNISLDLDGQVIPLDLSSLSFESNLDEILTEAYNQYALKGDEDINALIANYNARENLKKVPVQYTSAYTLSTEGISGIVHGILDDMSSEAVNAEVTGFDVSTLEFQYTQSAKGYVIDIDTAANDVKALLDSGVYEGVVTVSAEITEPEISSDVLATEYGRISTSSSQTAANANRNHNIQITCEKIDGMIINPGEEFSFNGFIGQRTPDKGYKLAGTIQDGQLKDDYGGGICQVTSMLYQSVIKSNLTVIDRNPHMWPSSYAVAGTDAAVDWPNQDFSFRNDSGYPIAIHIYWNPDNSYITAEIYGHLLPDGEYIEFVGEVVSHSSARTEYVADTSMSVGQRESVRGAHDGVTATSYQVWYNKDGVEINRVELPLSNYYAINAQIRVGVRNPDGSIATLNTDGTVSGGHAGETTTTESTQSSETTAATQAPQTEPQPTETQAPPPPQTEAPQPEPVPQDPPAEG